MTKPQNDPEYNKLKAEFTKASGKIVIFKTDTNRTLPTDTNTLKKYLDDLLNAYDNFAEYVNKHFQAQTVEKQTELTNKFEKFYKKRAIEAIEVLGVTVERPTDFNPFDKSTLKLLSQAQTTASVQPTASSAAENLTADKNSGDTAGGSKTTESNAEEQEEDTDIPNLAEVLEPKDNEITELSNQNSPTNSRRNSNFSEKSQNIFRVNPTMADQTVKEFLEMANPLLKSKFNGNPLKLSSFIRDIHMVNRVATSDAAKTFCITLVLSHLEEVAAEVVPTDTD